ncbi:hypothetical protein ES703_83377 [subsurface metagenome]
MELLDREEIIKRGATLIVATEETISTMGCPEVEGQARQEEFTNIIMEKRIRRASDNEKPSVSERAINLEKPRGRERAID